MTTFLERILATKMREVAALRQAGSGIVSPDALTRCRGFAHVLESANHVAVVAEVKKASPSKGLIRADFDPVQMARTYDAAGASAISVLTDETYFQGSIDHLRRIRQVTELPLLRKDFVIDELQIDEARVAGADAVLLICAAVSPRRLEELSSHAHSIGLDVLVEVHSVDELDGALAALPDVIGVNSRNLHTFQVNQDNAEQVINMVPRNIPVIAESGIQGPQDAARFAGIGVRALLIGEALMRLPDEQSVLERIASFRNVMNGARVVPEVGS